MTAGPDEISFRNIEVTADRLWERDGKQRLAFVTRAEIEKIELVDGFVAERQLAQIALAGALLASGGYLFQPLLRLLTGDNIVLGRAPVIGMFLASFGVAVLVGSLKRGPHLRIETQHGVRKLILRKDRDYDPAEARAFVEDVRQRLGQ